LIGQFANRLPDYQIIQSPDSLYPSGAVPRTCHKRQPQSHRDTELKRVARRAAAPSLAMSRGNTKHGAVFSFVFPWLITSGCSAG
jgi:hypothetical protein